MKSVNRTYPTVLCIMAFAYFFIIPNSLIFGFAKEARDDFWRMFPALIIGNIVWIFSFVLIVFGICVGPGGGYDLGYACLAFIFAGGSVPVYWIKKIIIDDVPAFGSNPNTIYSVVGVNSIVCMVIFAVVGLVVSFILDSSS